MAESCSMSCLPILCGFPTGECALQTNEENNGGYTESLATTYGATGVRNKALAAKTGTWLLFVLQYYCYSKFNQFHARDVNDSLEWDVFLSF